MALIERCGYFPVFIHPTETAFPFVASSKQEAFEKSYEAYGGEEIMQISVKEASMTTLCFGPFEDNFGIVAYNRKEDIRFGN